MKKERLFLNDHHAIEVTPITEGCVRVRYNASGIFRETLTERYELIELPEGAAFTAVRQEGETTYFEMGVLTLAVEGNGVFTLHKNGEAIVGPIAPIDPEADEGAGATLPIADGERFYGCGYRPNRDIELRGQVVKNWCSPVTNNGPSPWFMSSRGYGILWNHTGETYFDFGNKKEDELVMWSPWGEVDLFLFVGSFKELLGSYTDLTGKPTLMPLFAYGITTVCTETETEMTLIDKAERLRREGIPMDTFSIACEWMKKYYDSSIKQEFDTDRYFVTPWMRTEQTFIHALRRFGIKTVLWTCCEYDLTHEQERRYLAKHPEAAKEPRYDRSVRRLTVDDMSIDANSRQFRDERLYAKRYHDPYTVPGEAWAEHFKKFFDLGVVGIAEDGSSVELTKVDHCYGNGYTAREMHNLCQSLNAYQYHHIYREHTGRRIFVRTPSTFIGHQRFCGTWCGDTTSETSLMGLLQYSFQGESNVTADMIGTSREQIHFGMLMPWVLNFCWAHPVWPWMLPDELGSCFRDYARLRYALIPYIYTAAYQAHKTGVSLCSAMVIHYPEDKNLYNESNQFMLGDDFLVGAHSEGVYLPKGKWIDYWTGREYEGPLRVTEKYPEDKGGYLFVRRGAIIPRWQAVQFVGDRPIDRMTVEIYPDGEGSYTLYEDDGESFAYEEGGFSLTDITYREEKGTLTVAIAKARGDYEGRPRGRQYDCEVYTACPAHLPDGAIYDREKGAVLFSLKEGEELSFTR